MIPCQSEINWNQQYFDGEVESDDTMLEKPVYTLYKTSWTEQVKGRERSMGYVSFLNNARRAKGDVGELITM